jgi:hypothetical protein
MKGIYDHVILQIVALISNQIMQIKKQSKKPEVKHSDSLRLNCLT